MCIFIDDTMKMHTTNKNRVMTVLSGVTKCKVKNIKHSWWIHFHLAAITQVAIFVVSIRMIVLIKPAYNIRKKPYEGAFL